MMQIGEPELSIIVLRMTNFQGTVYRQNMKAVVRIFFPCSRVISLDPDRNCSICERIPGQVRCCV